MESAMWQSFQLRGFIFQYPQATVAAGFCIQTCTLLVDRKKCSGNPHLCQSILLFYIFYIYF